MLVMALLIGKTRSIFTAASTLCIGDFVKADGNWVQVLDIKPFNENDTGCVVRTSTGIIEAGFNMMVEVSC